MTALPESTITGYNRTRNNRPGVVKLFPPITPPDEKTIRRLNDLAATQPFCRLHRVKEHGIL